MWPCFQAYFCSDWVEESLFTLCLCLDSAHHITISDNSFSRRISRANNVIVWLLFLSDSQMLSPLNRFSLDAKVQSIAVLFMFLLDLVLTSITYVNTSTGTIYLLDSPTTGWPSSVLIMIVSEHLESRMPSLNNSNNSNIHSSFPTPEKVLIVFTYINFVK